MTKGFDRTTQARVLMWHGFGLLVGNGIWLLIHNQREKRKPQPKPGISAIRRSGRRSA